MYDRGKWTGCLARRGAGEWWCCDRGVLVPCCSSWLLSAAWAGREREEGFWGDWWTQRWGEVHAWARGEAGQGRGKGRLRQAAWASGRPGASHALLINIDSLKVTASVIVALTEASFLQRRPLLILIEADVSPSVSSILHMRHAPICIHFC
jgi:hypothetical protein